MEHRLPIPRLPKGIISILEEHFTWQNFVESDGLPPYLGQRITHSTVMARNDGSKLHYSESTYEYVRCEDCAGLVSVQIGQGGEMYDPHPRCHICEAFVMACQDDPGD